MLDLLSIEGTDFVKAGYTARCPWQRVCDGFWRLVHPPDVCGKLGYENLRLLCLSPGTLEDEERLHAAIPPVAGEFWHRGRAEMIKLFFKVNSIGEHACDNDNWELPLPDKPSVPPIGRGVEKRSCCGGADLLCYGCGARFGLWIHLSTHRQESCPALYGRGAKETCERCHTKVIKRNLKRHHQSRACAVPPGEPSSGSDATA